MPVFRVNVRQVETSLIVRQVEVVAEDAEHAAVYAYHGVWRDKDIWDSEQVVRTKVRRLDPDTYAVTEAAALEEMERISREFWTKKAKKPKIGTHQGEAQDITLPMPKT